jgi:hypothetical protein
MQLWHAWKNNSLRFVKGNFHLSNLLLVLSCNNKSYNVNYIHGQASGCD